MLIDSHCHLNCLDLSESNASLDDAIELAHQNDVTHFLCVSIDLDHVHEVIAAADAYHQVFASVGLHPNEIVADEPCADDLIRLANHPKVIAIGETGLDYYRSEGDLSWQQERFRRHIQAAKTTEKALIVHSRDAETDTLKILKEERAEEVGGVLHCFTGSWEMAQTAMAMDFYISFSGIITFKNAVALQEIVRKMPLDRILVETDAPYLAPVPFRGKPNQPAYVKYVAQCIAELKQISYQEVCEKTSENFFKLFKSAKAEA